MTIIVAGNTGKEVYFCYDTATSLFSNEVFDSIAKVNQIGKYPVAIGFAGYIFRDVWDAFADWIPHIPDKLPYEAVIELIERVPMIREYTSFLMGFAEDERTRLFAYGRETGYTLSEVDVFGIGSGMYDETSQKLHRKSEFNSPTKLRTHLEDTVIFAKKLDRKRDMCLFGFGVSVLDGSGYKNDVYENALDEFNEMKRLGKPTTMNVTS